MLSCMAGSLMYYVLMFFDPLYLASDPANERFYYRFSFITRAIDTNFSCIFLQKI